MSDIEHEFLVENEVLRAELRRVREIAERALDTAKNAQNRVAGRHEPSLDEARDALAREEA